MGKGTSWHSCRVSSLVRVIAFDPGILPKPTPTRESPLFLLHLVMVMVMAGVREENLAADAIILLPQTNLGCGRFPTTKSMFGYCVTSLGLERSQPQNYTDWCVPLPNPYHNAQSQIKS